MLINSGYLKSIAEKLKGSQQLTICPEFEICMNFMAETVRHYKLQHQKKNKHMSLPKEKSSASMLSKTVF